MAGPAAVLYAKDVAAVSAFYAAVAGLAELDREDDHTVLEAPGFQLVVLAVPAELAAAIEITTPPHRREDTPIKLAFPVESIAVARVRAATLGGEVAGADRQWEFQDALVCDGVDPEGNVFQLREPLG